MNLFFFPVAAILIFFVATEPYFLRFVDLIIQSWTSFLGKKVIQAKMEAELVYVTVDKNRYLDFVKTAYPENPEK